MYDCYAAGIAMAGGWPGPCRSARRPDGAGPWTFDPASCARRSRRARGCCCSTPRTTPPARSSPRDELTSSPRSPSSTTCSCSPTRSTSTSSSAAPSTLDRHPAGHARTHALVVGSAGKTFNVTGWKIGWICGPAPLVSAVRTAKQFLTYVNGGPFQPAVAAGLAMPDAYFEHAARDLEYRRDVLVRGCATAASR